MKDRNLERGRLGIVCSLVEEPDDTVRLVIDDVMRRDPSLPEHWTTTALFTSREYGKAELLAVDLSEKDLADIGLNVVARLAALAQTHAGGSDAG